MKNSPLQLHGLQMSCVQPIPVKLALVILVSSSAHLVCIASKLVSCICYIMYKILCHLSCYYVFILLSLVIIFHFSFFDCYPLIVP